MRYELPRYIEEEAKIVGPVNMKQFFIFFGAAAVCAMFFFFLKPPIAVFFSIIVMGITTIMIFGKYRGRPIYAILGGVLRYVWAPRTYVWQKPAINQQDLYQETTREQEPETPTQNQESMQVTEEDLKKIAQQLDKK